MPLSAAALLSYDSPVAITCPLPALRRKRNPPLLSLYSSNCAAIALPSRRATRVAAPKVGHARPVREWNALARRQLRHKNGSDDVTSCDATAGLSGEISYLARKWA